MSAPFDFAHGVDAYKGKPLIGMTSKVLNDNSGDFELPMVDLKDPFYKVVSSDGVFEIQDIQVPYIKNKTN